VIKNICVCGLGKLGSPIAALFAANDVNVVGLDLDETKVLAINTGRAPVQEPGLERLIKKTHGRTLRATAQVLDAIRGTEACCFITLTPSLADGSFSNEYLIVAMKSVAHEVYARRISDYVFIINSTVTPGSCEKVFLPLLREAMQELPFHLVYKPEFIALGSVIDNLQYPDFGLFGVSSKKAADLTTELYERGMNYKVQEGYKVMTLIEAELAKISVNCALTTKISFANQVGALARKLGANPHVVLDAVGSDRRVGRSCLRFGMPYGGPCLPRDNRLFQYTARGLTAPLLSVATDDLNEALIYSIAAEIQNKCNYRNFGTIGILGQSYKPNTPVTEESPGLKLKELLMGMGYTVKTHDPQAPHSHSLAEVLISPVIVIATAWLEYKTLNYENKVLIDPMGVVEKTVGIGAK